MYLFKKVYLQRCVYYCCCCPHTYFTKYEAEGIFWQVPLVTGVCDDKGTYVVLSFFSYCTNKPTSTLKHHTTANIYCLSHFFCQLTYLFLDFNNDIVNPPLVSTQRPLFFCHNRSFYHHPCIFYHHRQFLKGNWDAYAMVIYLILTFIHTWLLVVWVFL